MELYISNLDITTSEDQLINLLAPFGDVTCSKVKTIADYTKEHKNTFAYIHVDSRTSAEAIISKLHNTLFLGRAIIVKEAK